MFLTRTKAIRPELGLVGHDLAVFATVKLRIEAALLRVLWWGSLLLGPERASDVGARLIGLLAGPRSHMMRRMRRNLVIALPDEAEDRIVQLAKEAMAGLGRAVIEYPHLQRMAGPDLEHFVEFAADVPEAKLTAVAKPAIYVGMHQANWEVLSSIASPLGSPVTIVVSPLTNPFVHRLVSRARPDVWVKQTERDTATRSLMRCLQGGGKVAMLADQRFEGGQMVPFFGHDAMTAIGPAKLAIRYGCDLVPLRIERIGKVRFRITTYAAIPRAGDIVGNQDQAIDMMRRINLLFESWIRQRPEQWMCMKRRWPHALYQCADQAGLLPPAPCSELG